NVIEHTAALCTSTGETILPDHLPDTIRSPGTPKIALPAPTLTSDGQSGGSGVRASTEDSAKPSGAWGRLRPQRENFERRQIVEALAQADGNITRTAEMLGLPRRTLSYKMERLGIQPPNRR